METARFKRVFVVKAYSSALDTEHTAHVAASSLLDAVHKATTILSTDPSTAELYEIRSAIEQL